MTYRSETTGIELHRIRHEEAKATLEELAGWEYIDLPRIESALQTMGFQKEAEILYPHLYPQFGPMMMYSRETAGGIELLVDRDLTRIYDKVPHLYRLPAGQDVEERCKQIPSYKTKKDLTAKRLATSGGILATIAVIANTINFQLPQNQEAFIYLFGSIIEGVLTGVGIYELLTRKSKLHNQTIAKGPEALHYIANTKYVTPKLRVETKPRIVDAEFTDQPINGLAELEALAVEQSAEVKRLTKK